jgi:hypothetical protein
LIASQTETEANSKAQIHLRTLPLDQKIHPLDGTKTSAGGVSGVLSMINQILTYLHQKLQNKYIDISSNQIDDLELQHEP